MYITESGASSVKTHFSSDGKIDLMEIKKNLEKGIITNIFAPLLLGQKSSLKSQYDTLFTDVAKSIQESVQVAADQLDDSMKGQFSKKVVTTLKENSKKYEEI